jgi:ATP/maltotriose-dependent transcriptional regulator MalT
MDSLIGRIRERSELFREIDNASNGRGSLILISGESGVGKSRLIEEVISKSGMNVFTARSNDEGNSSYYLFKCILADITAHPDYSEVVKSPFLSLFFPDGEIPEDPGTEAIHNAVTAFLQEASVKHPILLFFDDIQWADNASLDLVRKTAEKISSIPLMIIASYRSEEITSDHKIRRIRNLLRRSRKVKEIEIKPLNFEETKELIEQIVKSKVDESTAEIIYNHTQGLPLFTEEVVQTLIDENILIQGDNGYEISGSEIPVPETIKDAVQQRISSLSDNARNFIESASVLGIEFPIDAAISLSGSEEGIDELLEKKLLVEISPVKMSFRHALIKEAVRSGIPWTRRKDLHYDAALFYEEYNYSPEIITEHWLLANEREKARDNLIKSIDLSCSMHAFNDAAEKANLALQIWPEHKDEETRIKILYRYAHCSQINGQTDEALKAITEITLSSRFAEDSSFAAEVYRLQAAVYGLKGAWMQSVQARLNAAAQFMEAGIFGESALEYLIAAGRSSAMLSYDRALEAADLAVKMAEEGKRNDLKARALGLYGNILAMQGKYTAGKDVVSKALNIALQSRDQEAASEVYRRLASTLEYASDYSAAKDAYFSAYDYCLSTGENVNAQVCLGCMSYIFFQTGDWKDSLEICRKVIISSDSPEGSKAVAYGITGIINVFKGEIKSAERNLTRAFNLSKKLRITSLELASLWGFAILYELEGKNELVLEKYNAVIQKWYDTQDTHDVIQIIMWASEFFARQKLVKENAICVEILTSIASSTGNPEAMAALAFALAESSVMNNNFQEAEKQYIQALEHLEKLKIPIEQVAVEYRLGCCLTELAQNDKAAIYLNRAYRTAKNLSARPLSSRIAAKMNEIGLHSEESRNASSKERASSAGLTRRQKEILLLLSEGLTNKQISDKIFLSTRTVDMHVSNILQRFNSRTRTEAVSKAKELHIL